jgi:polyphosphate kinase
MSDFPRNEEFRLFNRELSWIEFNRRVLDEARQTSNPVMERIKFLAIVSSNFDEFFMVRVASLRRAIKNGNQGRNKDDEAPSETLKRVHEICRRTYAEQYGLWDQLLAQLADHGLRRVAPHDYSQEQLSFVREYYQKELFNVLSPVKVEEKRPFPFTGNLRMNLAFLIEPLKPTVGEEDARMIVLEIPPYLSRIVWLPESRGGRAFSFIEDVVATLAEQLVPGYKLVDKLAFRITRDADIPVDEEKEEDFVDAMTKILRSRLHSNPMRLEVEGGGDELRSRLLAALDVDPSLVYSFKGPLNLKDLFSLAGLSGFDHLRAEPWNSRRSLPDDEDIWELVRQEDRLLFHPYESFSPLVRLLTEAAIDPNVLSIRMTLYRTSGESPIVQALAKAAFEGKQVTVLVELKARFDEEQNLGWAQTLEQAGGIVIYGVAGLKVHAKATLIVRRESDGIRRYAHLGTGNYNEKTARLYSDFGLLTARPDYTHEVAQFFNAITGYSAISRMRYLIMAPHYLKGKLISLIDGLTRQAKLGVPCRIAAKMNSLADDDVIQALYRASQAGVTIDLNVRGICMLVPGASFSSRIRVVSIVDRYLEHARIFVFRAGEVEDVYLSSADWMFRNLERRVELMFPILSQAHKERIVEALEVWFSDNVKAHVLQTDGRWLRRIPGLQASGVLGEERRAQEVFHRRVEAERELDRKAVKHDLVVRRKPKTE